MPIGRWRPEVQALDLRASPGRRRRPASAPSPSLGPFTGARSRLLQRLERPVPAGVFEVAGRPHRRRAGEGQAHVDHQRPRSRRSRCRPASASWAASPGRLRGGWPGSGGFRLTLAGTAAGPVSPPRRRASRESRSRPPLTFEASAEWQPKQEASRTGRIFSRKNRSPSASAAPGGRRTGDEDRARSRRREPGPGPVREASPPRSRRHFDGSPGFLDPSGPQSIEPSRPLIVQEVSENDPVADHPPSG